MPSSLIKMDYPYKDMKLTRLYKNEKIKLTTIGIECENLEQVYGENLMFPEIYEDRPYTYSSLVTSIDGKIAFSDAPEGPFISSKNYLGGAGSVVDWWTLNVLRASSDAIIFGANTLSAEPNGTGHVYDSALEAAREKAGMNAVPWNIIPTLDGSDVPFQHMEFTCGEVPVMFYTSPEGLEVCKANVEKDFVVLGPFKEEKDIDFVEFIPDVNKIYIIVTGEGKFPNNKLGLKVLRKLGIKKLLVESPTLMHIFTTEQLMDELFFNYSCVYLGGKALTIGMNGKEFNSIDHPHTELITVYMHSPHFMYFRHKLIYNVKG